MSMPTMPGQDPAPMNAETAHLGEILAGMSPEEIEMLVEEAHRAAADGDLDGFLPTGAPAAEDAGGDQPTVEEQPEPTMDEANETAADEAAETDEEQQAEADAGEEQHTAQQYADQAAAGAAELDGIYSRLEELQAGAEEHEEAGLDPGIVEDAITRVEELVEEATAACDAATEAAAGDEPDIGTAAEAADSVNQILEEARALVTEVEQKITEDANDAVPEEQATMRAWVDSVLGGGGPKPTV